MKKGLLALALGGLALGMAEFCMMGILPDIAKDLNQSIPTAAHLIAFYALGVFVGAPTLVLITGKYSPKRVLVVLMLAFFILHSTFALSPNYPTIAVMRFLAGFPHGAFYGVGTVVAARMATKGKEAQAISIMFTGMTVANLLGVPLGTYIGHNYSWRWTYAIIAVLGLITSIACYCWLPPMKGAPTNNIREQLHYFKTKEAWYLIALVSIGTGGLFAWVSYIAPMVESVSGLPSGKVPFIMTLVGLGMFCGNLLGGKLADTISPTKAAMTSLIGMIICLVAVYYTSPIKWTAYPMAFITGMTAFTIGPCIQMMLIRTANGAENLAAAVGQASFNLGNTLGAFLGGVPITLGFAYNSPVLVGAGLAFSGVLISIGFYHRIVLKKYR